MSSPGEEDGPARWGGSDDIKALTVCGVTRSEIARLLGVTEGAVRYHANRMAAGTVDGRSRQVHKAAAHATAIEQWRSRQEGDRINLAALHAWLCVEHGYEGSLRSVQRYWKDAYPAPASGPLHCVAHNLKKLHAHRLPRHATGQTPVLH